MKVYGVIRHNPGISQLDSAVIVLMIILILNYYCHLHHLLMQQNPEWCDILVLV